MDNRLLVLSISFVILSVFMSVPQPGAGVQGVLSWDEIDVDNSHSRPVEGETHHPEEHLTENRPSTHCHETRSSRQCCQNLASHSINNITSQIRMELNASHTYLAMAAYFGRDDVAYRGFAKFFMKASDEERDHAVKFIDYLNKRGGHVSLKTIYAPEKQEWLDGPYEAVVDALYLERAVNDALLDLHWEAQHKNDPHLQDFLESEYLTEQVDSIRELSGWATILRRLSNDPLGLHQFDEELFNGSRG